MLGLDEQLVVHRLHDDLLRAVLGHVEPNCNQIKFNVGQQVMGVYRLYINREALGKPQKKLFLENDFDKKKILPIMFGPKEPFSFLPNITKNLLNYYDFANRQHDLTGY